MLFFNKKADAGSSASAGVERETVSLPTLTGVAVFVDAGEHVRAKAAAKRGGALRLAAQTTISVQTRGKGHVRANRLTSRVAR